MRKWNNKTKNKKQNQRQLKLNRQQKYLIKQ